MALKMGMGWQSKILMCQVLQILNDSDIYQWFYDSPTNNNSQTLINDCMPQIPKELISFYAQFDDFFGKQNNSQVLQEQFLKSKFFNVNLSEGSNAWAVSGKTHGSNKQKKIFF